MNDERKEDKKKEAFSGLQRVPETPEEQEEQEEITLYSLQELKVEFLPALRERGGARP